MKDKKKNRDGGSLRKVAPRWSVGRTARGEYENRKKRKSRQQGEIKPVHIAKYCVAKVFVMCTRPSGLLYRGELEGGVPRLERAPHSKIRRNSGGQTARRSLDARCAPTSPPFLYLGMTLLVNNKTTKRRGPDDVTVKIDRVYFFAPP